MMMYVYLHDKKLLSEQNKSNIFSVKNSEPTLCNISGRGGGLKQREGGVSSVAPVTAICFTIFSTFERRSSNKVFQYFEFGSQTEFQRSKEEAVCHLSHLLPVIFSSSIREIGTCEACLCLFFVFWLVRSKMS